LALASFAVNAQLQTSRLDNLGDATGAMHAVVFFESSVRDYQVLRQGLGVGTDAVLLDSTGDGLQEMATYLASRHGLAAVGLVAHGSPGAIALGTATLNDRVLGSYQSQLASIGAALASGGELDLWSCDAAAGQVGAALVRDLALATNAGVAGADHLIGSADVGGNWQLDVRTGGALGQLPFSGAAMAAFSEVLGLAIKTANNSGKGYAGLDSDQTGQAIPPDSNGAAGPTSYVETVNQVIAIYPAKATGTAKIAVDLPAFFSGLAPVSSSAGFSDPVVIYDDNMPGLTALSGRFIVGDVNIDDLTGRSVFDIGVSKSASPATLTAADWSFYRINTTESGCSADFPGNFGYNRDAFVFTLNQLGNSGPPDHAEVFSVSSTDLVNGVSQAQLHFFHNDVNDDFSLRPTTMHDAPAGAPMWLLSEAGDALHLNVYKMTSVLSNAAVLAKTQLTAKGYVDIGSLLPLQPNGSIITDVIDSAIQKVSEANNILVATHAVSVSSTQDSAQWYAIDVSSGAPVMQQQGRVGLGNKTYATFPSIDINSLGYIGMTFMGSGTGAGQFMSMYVTGRRPTDPVGTMETPLLVPAGSGIRNYVDSSSGGRAGDISGISVDPADGSFWAVNEFANAEAGANWGTAIANFTVFDASVPDPAQSTVTAAPLNVVTGSTAKVTLTARNAAGNQLSQGGLTFSFGTGAGGGSGAFSNLTDNKDGTYTATFTGATPGQVTITATLNGQPVTSTPPVLTVLPAIATQLVVGDLSATSVAAGAAVTFTVTAEDSAGNAIPSYTGTVALTGTDAAALVNGSPAPGIYTFVPADNGSHHFTIVFATAGAQTITATDQANNTLTGTTLPITVLAGPFSSYAVAVVGGKTFVAGSSFQFTVQATDQFGNAVTSYSGPASVTITATPPDPQSNLPITGALNSSGFGFFLGNLQTAGSYALTAAAGGFSGTSSKITVTPGTASYLSVGAPAKATTGAPFDTTITAYDHFGNIATGYTGTVKLTSSDPAAPTLVGSYTFTTGAQKDNGVHVFSTSLSTGGNQKITAADTVSTNPIIAGTSSPISARGLTVTALVPTSTGFTVTFSKPMVSSLIKLYGGTEANPLQNVTMVGSATGPIFGAVNGIFVIDPSGTSATFKASSDWLQNVAGSTSGVLPNDTWTVVLSSGIGAGSSANGFFDALGAPLDGANNGGQANYTTTFATGNDGRPALTLPDFARGPDGSSTIKAPNSSAKGIPVTLANAPAGTKDVVFTFNYNAALLTVTGGGTGDSSGAGSVFTAGTPGNGTVTFGWHNDAGLSGNIVLGDVLANVPNTAANLYRAKELLTLSAITVNGVAFTGATSPAVHVNAYFGDLSGDGQVTALDLAAAGNLAVGTVTSPIGLTAYPLVDPGLIGDIGGDGSIDSATISSLAGFLAHVATPSIPMPPAGLTMTPGGPDPILSLAVGRGSGGIINVLVLLDQARPAGSTGMTEAIIGLTYDPKALTANPADITLGSIPASGNGWKLQSVVDAGTGQIAIELYSTTPISQAQAGSLVDITFHVVPGAYAPMTAVQLVGSVTPQGHWFSTEVADGENKFVLSPGPEQLMIQTERMCKRHSQGARGVRK
jgi:hypothetical protein